MYWLKLIMLDFAATAKVIVALNTLIQLQSFLGSSDVKPQVVMAFA